MSGQGLDVLAGGHRSSGQGAEQRAIAGCGVSEQVQRQWRKLRYAKGPWNGVALGKGTEVKRR